AGVPSRGVEITTRQGAQRLHVQLPAASEPVKASAHEMPSAAFFEQAALAHGEARRFRHKRIGVFNGSIPFGVFEFLVFVSGDAIEFQQPVTEASSRHYLP